MEARGIRNNNPLNIEYNKESYWAGCCGNDGRFCKFSSMKWGYRAAFKILLTYRSRYRIMTIDAIAARWAPPSENPTSQYAKAVSERTCIPRNLMLSSRYEYFLIVLAMAAIECGTTDVRPFECLEAFKTIDWGYL